MTVCNFFINYWFANRLIFALYFGEVNGDVSILCCASFSQSFFECFFSFVAGSTDVVSFAIFFDVSVRIRIWQCFCTDGYFSQIIGLVFLISYSSFFARDEVIFWQRVQFIIAAVGLSVFLVSPQIVFYINFDVSFNSYCGNSVNILFTFVVLCIVYFLVISVQRHPDNVSWFEVNVFVVVQLGGSFLNDVAIFVGYKQFTVKFEVVRPISLVVRASAVGNSKSVSAHAKYHSRSQCYGKYFFHSLSSS